MESVTSTSSADVSKTSRVGKRPIDLPKGVTANVSGRSIDIKGPKGQLTRTLVDSVSLKLDAGKLHVSSTAPGRDGSRLQGLMRALVAAMVKGVAEGTRRLSSSRARVTASSSRARRCTSPSATRTRSRIRSRRDHRGDPRRLQGHGAHPHGRRQGAHRADSGEDP